MSISSLSPHVPTVTQNLNNDLRLQVNEGDNCCTTALKVVAVFAGLAAAIGSVVLFGPVAAVVCATVLVGAGLIYLFTKCCPTTPNHQHTHYAEPVIPWYQRFYNWIPAGNNYMNGQQHERVGAGRNDPHRGHGNYGHEPVGRGQNDPHRGHGNYGHEPVGAGHGRPHGGHHLQPPLRPSGPGGHEPVGNRGH